MGNRHFAGPLLVVATALLTGTAQEPATPQARQPDVTVRGVRSPAPCQEARAVVPTEQASVCAAARLQAAARSAQKDAARRPDAPATATSGDIAVGVGSAAASGQRLGTNLRHATTLPPPRSMAAPVTGHHR